MNLREAQRKMIENVGTGTECPLCHRPAKIYRYQINNSKAWLVSALYTEWLERGRPVEGLTTPQFPKRDGKFITSYNLLRHFGVIESPTRGHWLVTQQGKGFVAGLRNTPKYVWVLNNSCVKQSSSNTTISECLGVKRETTSLIHLPESVQVSLQALTSDITLDEARDKFREALKKGTRCPCCLRYCKVYPRKLTPDMLTVLKGLVQRGGSSDVYADFGIRGGDYGKLAYWGLATQVEGGWAPTEAGRQFVKGLIKQPSHVRVLNGTVMSTSDQLVTFNEAMA